MVFYMVFFLIIRQGQLTDISEMCNTHSIRQDRSKHNVGGVPEKLFFITEVRGEHCLSIMLIPAYKFIIQVEKIISMK